MNAIDTNVFVYALDAAEPAKQAKAREFFRRVLTSNESIWDSLLIAACQEASVTRLYTEDMQHGADYDGVNIVNPFA